MERRIAKLLSANDAGETGGHQAGILIPKDQKVLSFFPDLDRKILNPRCHIQFLDDGARSGNLLSSTTIISCSAARGMSTVSRA